MTKIQVNINGRLLDAELMDFETITEPKNRYQLPDGTVLEMRTTVIQISKVIGEVSDDGLPIYNLRSQNIVAVVPAADEANEH